MCCPETRQQENRGGAESTPVDRGRPAPREGRQKAIEPGLATLNLWMRMGRCQVRDGGGVHYSFGELRTTREGYQTVGQISARQNRQRKRLHRKIFTARRHPGPLGGVDVCRYYVCLSALGGAKEAGRRVGGPGCVMSGAAYNNQTLCGRRTVRLKVHACIVRFQGNSRSANAHALTHTKRRRCLCVCTPMRLL